QLAQRALAGGNTPWRLTNLGTAHYRAGKYTKAVQRLRESQAMNPNWEKTWNRAILAMACYRLNQADLARQNLDAAAAALEERTQTRLQRGEGYGGAATWWDLVHSTLHYREAKKLIDGAEPPDDPRLWVIRARTLEALGQYRQAVASYTKAIELKAD